MDQVVPQRHLENRQLALGDRDQPPLAVAERVQTDAGRAQLRRMIEAHVARTGSAKGRALLGDWNAAIGKFWQLVPPSEANTREASPLVEAEPLSDDDEIASVRVPAAAGAAA